MAKLHILRDENCLGQVEAIFYELDRLGYTALLGRNGLPIFCLNWMFIVV